MKYKEFELDQFQIDAIRSIENNHSVVVSAATGTGKTLIADYIIDKALKENKRVIYTAPIKALSNQKFRDFKKDGMLLSPQLVARKIIELINHPDFGSETISRISI